MKDSERSFPLGADTPGNGNVRHDESRYFQEAEVAPALGDWELAEWAELDVERSFAATDLPGGATRR